MSITQPPARPENTGTLKRNSQPIPRVRFAPSPTGFLHIGGVRTALFNYLYAKQLAGDFILRLEDTDRERFVVEGVEQIVEALDWFGLRPDEGFWEGNETGHVGPYVQSKRLPQYKTYIDQLIERKLAYPSMIGEAEYAALRAESQTAKRPFVYRRAMEPKTGNPDGRHPVRLDIAAVVRDLKLSTIDWQSHDGVEASIDPATIEDFVLLKGDDFPTYNFANVVDDHLMGITHILRGDEFISSTPKHALLFDILGWDRPIWVHLPVIIGADGAKLSKRHGDTNALQYRDNGYLPEAVLNFLALLGWNDGTQKEIFSLSDLIRTFSLDRIQKSPARFDIERLNWINGIYIREKLTETEYISRATAELSRAGIIDDSTDSELIRRATLLERPRIKFFSELPDMISFFFIAPEVESKQLSVKQSTEQAKQFLELAYQALDEKLASEAEIESALRTIVSQHDLKAGEIFAIIRLAITGRTAAPGLFETIATLGISETRARLKSAQSSLGA